MTDTPGRKVLDVQVFDDGEGFVAVEEMGTSCRGDSAIEALRGLGAAIREDADEQDAGPCERCEARPAFVRLQRRLDDVPTGTLDVCEACAPLYERGSHERTEDL